MSDVNNEVKTEEQTNTTTTNTSPAGKLVEMAKDKIKDIKADNEAHKGLSISQIEEMITTIDNPDTKILAQLMLELKKESDLEVKHAKRQSVFSLCTACVCLILVIVLLGWGIKFAPTVEKIASEAYVLVENTNALVVDTTKVVSDATDVIQDATAIVSDATAIVSEASGIVEQTGAVIDNLDKITTDLAATDIEGMMTNVNNLVISSEESMTEAFTKIESIDIESLNQAIADLQAVVAPLSKLFRK